MLNLPALPRNLEAAFRDLGSKKVDVRRSAVRDVARHGLGSEAVQGRAIAELVRLLQTDENALVRGDACVALADLGAESALPALLVAVEDVEGFVRQMALAALGEIGDGRARGRVERALKDERPELRYQALIAFSHLAEADSDKTALRTTLLFATNDDDDAVRYIAFRLLEEAYLRAPTSFASAKLEARLLEALADPHVDVVLASALLGAKLGTKASELGRSARGVLAEVVRTGKWRSKAPGKEDEGAALECVGELGMRELMPDLERRAYGLVRLFRDACSFNAKIALSRMGHERTVGDFLAGLSSRSRETRVLSIVAAGRARIERAKPALVALSADPSAGPDRLLVEEALRELDVLPPAWAEPTSASDR